MQTLDQRSASSHYTLHSAVHVDCQPCILVEFIYWYWTFSTNNWGDLCLLEVSLRPLDAGMGNVHYLEYVHTFILEYFPSEYYRKHISLIICFITAFVNLGVLLSRGNSNIFQGPNLPGPNLTIRTIKVWYRYQDELGFHPAVKGVAPLSWKEVLPLFLSFLVTMLSIYFFRAHLQSSRRCSSLHEISSFSLWVFCEGPWDGRCHSCCTWGARCTSRDYNVHTLCERKKTLNKKAKVQTCLLPPTATTIGSSTVASLPFVLVSVPATSLSFFILLQVFIRPDLCPCNKITQATFYLSFVLVWSLQQGPGPGPYNKVI